jgi:outer membrane receptor for ferrienterochelin and colicin
MNVGYTYLDAKYSDFVVNVNSGLAGSFISSCVPNTIIGTGVFCQANLSGNRLERTPKHSITGSARYSFPIADRTSVYAEGDVRYTSNRAVDEYNVRFIPAFTTANVRVGVETPTYSLLAYVDNVFDSDTIQGVVGVGDQNNPGNIANILQLPDRRHFGVRGSYKF